MAKDSIRNYLSKWLKDRNAAPGSAKAQATDIVLPPAETMPVDNALNRLQNSQWNPPTPEAIEESLRLIVERLDRIESRLDASDECLKQLTQGAGGVIDRLSLLESNSDDLKRQTQATGATLSRLGAVVFGAAQAMERTRDTFADLEDRRKAEREKLALMVGFGLLVIVLIGIAAVVLLWNR